MILLLDNYDSFYPRSIKEKNLSAVLANHDFTLVEGDIRDRDALTSLPDIDTIVPSCDGSRACSASSLEQS